MPEGTTNVPHTDTPDEGLWNEGLWHCDFCRRGSVLFRTERLRFRQVTGQGTLHCEVELPVGRCEVCGFTHVGAGADAAIGAEVERALSALG